jgi:hypothetical protein
MIKNIPKAQTTRLRVVWAFFLWAIGGEVVSGVVMWWCCCKVVGKYINLYY